MNHALSLKEKKNNISKRKYLQLEGDRVRAFVAFHMTELQIHQVSITESLSFNQSSGRKEMFKQACLLSNYGH